MRRLCLWTALSAVFLIVLSGCGGDEIDLSVPPTVVNTVPAAPSPTAVPTQAATVTPLPTPTSVAAAPTAEPTVEPTTETEAAYRVALVEETDTLNVRAGAGVNFDVVGTLSPDADEVRITGGGEIVDGSRWVPIEANGVSGWVNGYYLTQQDADFCRTDAPQQVVDRLRTAVRERDGAALAELVHPQRGMVVHESWWNPAVYFDRQTAADVFSSDVRYAWGTQDGSGNEIQGTFADVVLPRLDESLRAEPRDQACNEILAGGTAGMVRLPDGYDAVNYVSVYGPPTDAETEFEWQSVVVGVDRWQGQYYVRYLVFFDWEI